MSVDGLVHLGRSHFGTSLDAGSALAGMDEVGSAVALVAPVHPRGADFRAANEAVARDCADSGGRLVPLARVDPWEGPDALDELRRAVAAGAHGLFLHPAEEHFRINDDIVRPLVQAAAELGVPVVAAAGFHLYSEALQLRHAARWAPDNPFVLTNGGQFNISGMAQFDAELALGEPNVLVQTSGMYREDFLKRVVATVGPDRLMFASAAPAFSMAYERARVDLAGFGEEERRLILEGNARRVFGVPVLPAPQSSEVPA